MKKKGKGRKKTVSANLRETEYKELIAYLEQNNQTISEFCVMALGALLKDKDKKIEKCERDKCYLKNRAITIRVSDYIHSLVKGLANKNNCSVSDVVIQAIKDSMK